MLDIWGEADGPSNIQCLMAKMYRVVEGQEKNATMGLVNTIYEQEVLEALLEETKPELPEGSDELHYLLKTPFRYPPLKYGSRFGGRYEPSLFYGASNKSTSFSETAYYRFVYMAGMAEPFPYAQTVEFSCFSVSVRSEKGVFLDKAPFNQFHEHLISPRTYELTQRLGTSMRHSGVEIFQYESARDPNRGKNIALFSPNAFQSKKPLSIDSWLCKMDSNQIGFISKDSDESFAFTKNEFMHKGDFPSPAN